ncbi:hypothetical protein [Marispirochaeta sp.]|nr:hypothetical protein [Marispirochaeta sp.]
MKKLIIALIIYTIFVNSVFSEANRELIRNVFEVTGIIDANQGIIAKKNG